MAVVYQDKKYYSPVLFTPAINAHMPFKKEYKKCCTKLARCLPWAPLGSCRQDTFAHFLY